MLGRKTILIAEDNAFLALDLALAVEGLDGVVVGPVASVADALMLIETIPLAGAIVDCRLIDQDASPVVMALIERGIPLVAQTGIALPERLVAMQPGLRVLRKPAQAKGVLEVLVGIIDSRTVVPDPQ